MTRSLTYPILLLLLALPGCSKDPLSGNDATGPLIPLAIGNSWTYFVSTFDTNGVIIASEIDSARWRVLRDTSIAGSAWYYLAGSYVANRSDGYWIYLSSSPALYFKYPVIAGDSISIGNGLSVECTATAESDTMWGSGGPLYVYNVFSGRTLATQYYITPGLGIVAYETFGTTNAQRIYKRTRSQLVAHHVS